MINSSNRLLQRNQNMGGYKYSDHKRQNQPERKVLEVILNLYLLSVKLEGVLIIN